MASYALQLSAGIGVTAATGDTGLLPYLAGTSAFSGAGMALDPAIHTDIKERNWAGFADHASYHLPFVGAGRNAWDALQDNKPWQAAAHAGLLSLELTGFKAAGKVKWGGKVAKRLPQYTSVESLIERVGELRPGKKGSRKGSVPVQGNAEAIFEDLRRQYGAKLRHTDRGVPFFEFGEKEFVHLTGSSSGSPTIRIKMKGRQLKIRVENDSK